MQFKVKAVLFDVDGTLYNQSFLRLIMGIQIFFSCLIFPFKAVSKLKVIKYYRISQESLRNKKIKSSDLEFEQIRLTSELSKIDKNKVEIIIAKWFDDIPLKFIPFCKKRGLIETFKFLYQNQIRIGLYSDYPCEKKAKALKINNFVSVILSSMDKEILTFKPDPKGFIVSSERIGFPVENILYVGDRADVDIRGANLSGMKAVLLGKLPSNDMQNYSISNLKELISIVETINGKR